MLCSNPLCGKEIPATQEICPDCYSTKRVAPTANRNVIFVLSDLNEFNSNRAQRYLQPEPIFANFFADSQDAFEQITSKGPYWHLLLTDGRRLGEYSEAIKRFREKNPDCIIAVLSGSDSLVAPSEGVVVVTKATETDDWLAMMYGLLAQTK